MTTQLSDSFSSDSVQADDRLITVSADIVHNNILKVWRSLKSAPTFRKHDPTSLRSRVMMLDSNVNQMLSSELFADLLENDSVRNIEAICQKIVANETLKLKSLKLWKSQDFPVSDELLKKVKERINLDFAHV